MLLHITDLSGEPLYRQISQQLVARILAGDLRQGAELKPARMLAREQRVSVYTVERAYQELAQEGLITYRNGKGFFINLLSPMQQQALTIHQLVAEAQERQRLEDELATARQIQADLLPKTLPNDDRVAMAAYSMPARVIGGDFYDCLPIDERRFGLVIGDASGKGLPAALLISQIQAMLKSEVNHGNSMQRVLENMNDQLMHFTAPGKFVTLFYGIFDRQTGVFEYANAGHNYPVVMRQDGSHEFLETGGLLLGAFPGAQYQTNTVTLGAGDCLLLYTDGVTETTNPDQEEYGEQRLLDLLARRRHHRAQDILQTMLEELSTFRASSAAQDDLTMMVLKMA